ncbi:polysaccharide pyruvyl transferase family protein [Caldisalinibacter kiritimatiensis]|uniref:Polysaccharide pyruvyl transferase domain-containing protein n=1 Tax=Caldisalinibacter kiritimatiensis TaxID=1304284 RepID=R1ATW7_9FIRM|nr:polysaccharide pyruvyl transferase family protein [Caldisalinibacter kiritimatiensis]EOD00107.1 hypothetical protein L21TH_1873 [Caldisalinibacter kiritimatiensis]
MKKIGLFTINDYNNYGNRLQNYAVQEYLKSLGFEVETIRNGTKYSKYSKRPNLISRVENLIKLTPREAYIKVTNKFLEKVNNNKIKELKNSRERNFKKFTKEHILETDYSISDTNIPEDLSNNYDYFITGSDQVWNPYNHRTSDIDFLTFAPRNKRIALSPSFGVSKIPEDYIERYRKWISEINSLSVREYDGAKIIKDLTGREVPVLVDPTLLLKKEKWLSISKVDSNKPSKKYLLTYFLGGVPKKYKEQIAIISKRNNLDVVNLGDIREELYYAIGPSQFLDYINSCSIFCTDSFHGAVFSILLEKPFLIYNREGSSVSMYSRIDTLLDKFDLHSRKAESFNINSNNTKLFEVDYSHVTHILDAERNKALEYLTKALGVKGEN